LHEIYFNNPQISPVCTVSSSGKIKERETHESFSADDDVIMVDSDLTTPDKATKFSPGRLLPQAGPNTSRSAVPRAPPTSRKRAKSDIVEGLEEIDRNKRKRHEEKIERKDKMFKWFRERFSQ
jgi:hypothetical protein